jgi:hypothetical protein
MTGAEADGQALTCTESSRVDAMEEFGVYYDT